MFKFLDNMKKFVIKVIVKHQKIAMNEDDLTRQVAGELYKDIFEFAYKKDIKEMTAMIPIKKDALDVGVYINNKIMPNEILNLSNKFICQLAIHIDGIKISSDKNTISLSTRISQINVFSISKLPPGSEIFIGDDIEGRM